MLGHLLQQQSTVGYLDFHFQYKVKSPTSAALTSYEHLGVRLLCSICIGAAVSGSLLHDVRYSVGVSGFLCHIVTVPVVEPKTVKTSKGKMWVCLTTGLEYGMEK